MNNLVEELLIAVVASVLTLFARFVVTRSLIPWWDDLNYKGVRLEGTWDVDAVFGGEELAKRTLRLERHGYRIFGDLESTSGHDQGHRWRVEGEYKNNLLTLAYATTQSQGMDRGTLTLMLKENGRKLVGFCAHYSNSSDTIGAAKYSCTRRTP